MIDPLYKTFADYEKVVSLPEKRIVHFARERTVRLCLSHWWIDKPKRYAAWLMLNPSTADHLKDDPTTRRVTHFSKIWGLDGWVIVNLYPWISSNPKDIWYRARWYDHDGWYDRDDLMINQGVIETIARKSALRVAAFGAQPFLRDEEWLEQCLEGFEQPAEDEGSDEDLYCLGTNKQGQPLHPMARGKWRVPDDRQPRIWRRTPENVEVLNV